MASTSRSVVGRATAILRGRRDLWSRPGAALLTALWLTLSACGSSSGGSTGTYNEAPDVNYNFGQDSASSGDAVADSGGATPTDDVVAGGDTLGTGDGEADSGPPDAGDLDADEPDADGPDAGEDTDVADTSADTGPSCGDGACNGEETCLSCAADCGACPAFCGDGSCGQGEDCKSCSQDCGTCPASCGNGKCEAALGESCKACPQDCGSCPATCGNGKCDGASGESCQVCPDDCGKCPALCGDGACNGTDTCQNCPVDCGVCPGGCGDGTCQANESCSSCSADCGQCPGVCSPLTSDGCAPAQQCYPVSTGTPLCGTPGTKAKGVTCSGATDCAKGLLCVGKICKSVCDATKANTNFLCQSGTCNELNWGDGKPIGYNLGACFENANCNLVTDVGCAADQTCDILQAGKTCLVAGAKSLGQGCTSLDECAKGLMCIGNPQQCLQKCNTSTGGCPGGKTCLKVTIDSKGTAAPDNLGVCN